MGSTVIKYLCVFFHDTGQRQQSVDQFLSRLPQSVIKEGKIIDVRSGVANIIKVCQSRHFVTCNTSNNATFGMAH